MARAVKWRRLSRGSQAAGQGSRSQRSHQLSLQTCSSGSRSLSHQDHYGPSSSSQNLPQVSAFLYPSLPTRVLCSLLNLSHPSPLPSLSSLIIMAWYLHFLAPPTASKLVSGYFCSKRIHATQSIQPDPLLRGDGVGGGGGGW